MRTTLLKHLPASKLLCAIGLVALLAQGRVYATNTFVVPFNGLKPEVALAISPGSVDFGGVALGQTGTQNVTIFNNGGSTATDLQYQATTGFTVSGNCTTSLGPGAQCTEAITFTPTAGAPVTGTFTVTNGAQSAAAPLTALGLQTSDSINVGSLNFGNQQVGTTSAPQSVVLNNTGNTPVSISSIGTVGPYTATQSCGPTLAVGDSCTVDVTFTPTSLNSNPGTLTFVTNGGNQNVTLTGNGQSVVLAVAPTSLTFGGVMVGQSTTKTFNVTNTGNIPAPSIAVSVPSGFTQSNNCGSSLGAGNSCTVSVIFTPTGMSTYSGNVQVSSSSASQSVPVSGNGLQVVMGASPTSLPFGNVMIGQSATQSFTLSNTGNTAATLSLSMPTGYTQTNNCGASLAAGGNCSVSVTFTPTSMSAYNGNIQVTSNGNTVTVAVSGNGMQTSDQASVGSLNFGNQPVGSTSAAQSVVLNNTGNTPVTITSIGTTGAYAATQSCGSSLAVGASCTVNVTFTPSTIGTSNGTLTFNTNGGNQTVSLTGTGQAVNLSASPASLAFGAVTVGQSSTKSFTLTNTGNIAATSLSYALPSGYTQSNNCGSSLGAGNSCTVSITFTPPGMSSYGGSVQASSAGHTASVSVSGSGQAVVLGTSPNSLGFGNVVVGQSATQGFTLSNSGNVAATGLSIAVPNGYSQTNNCGSSLAAGGNCWVSVTFAPGASTGYSGNVQISSNGGSTTNWVSGAGVCGAGAQAFTGNGTFYPRAGCSTYLVLVVGGGASGSGGYYMAARAGGAGYVNVSYANGLSSPVGVSIGGGGDVNIGQTGGTSCFGGICAGGGNVPLSSNYPGNFNSNGGSGGSGQSSNLGATVGGSWGGNSADGGGIGQGGYGGALALFKMNSVTGGPGGQGTSLAGGFAYGGGGGGGILFNGGGPTGGSQPGGGSGGVGYGAGGGGPVIEGGRMVYFDAAGGSGAPGLVYVEWTQ